MHIMTQRLKWAIKIDCSNEYIVFDCIQSTIATIKTPYIVTVTVSTINRLYNAEN